MIFLKYYKTTPILGNSINYNIKVKWIIYTAFSLNYFNEKQLRDKKKKYYFLLLKSFNIILSKYTFKRDFLNMPIRRKWKIIEYILKIYFNWFYIFIFQYSIIQNKSPSKLRAIRFFKLFITRLGPKHIKFQQFINLRYQKPESSFAL